MYWLIVVYPLIPASSPKYLVVLLLRGYRYFISPLFPSSCRFTPTCSQYAITAINQFGILKGGVMMIKRLLRCHPGCAGGWDPVHKVGDNTTNAC